MKEGYHVHNAEMVQAEDWGGTQTLLRFKGVSCGHGYGANEATIFIGKDALKKMIGIIRLGESDSVPKEPPLPTEPPCLGCIYWKPQRRYDMILCCTTPNDMWGDFSCHRSKIGER